MPNIVRLATLMVAAASLSAPAFAQFDLRGVLSNVITGAAASAAGDAAAKAMTTAGQDAAAAAPAAAPAPVYTEAELQAALQSPGPALSLPSGSVKSNMALKGKRFYIAEYRVLFEVGGRVTANTRAAYFGGIDRGATRSTVNYSVGDPNIPLMQAITDRAYADLVAQLESAGVKPEPTDAFVQSNGAVYEATVDATRPGAEVYEEVDLGHGTRKYLVFAPKGMKMLARGFAGIGAGDIGKRIAYSKGQLEGLSFGMAVNLAAQESSGSGSALFKRGSSASASAAMELVMPPRQAGALQGHALGQAVSLTGAIPVPGQFANFRESGGYDSSKDAAVRGLQVLGALTMGVAGNNSKRVDMAIDVDQAAMARQVLQGLAAVHKEVAAGIQ